ncbi:hypothetical protein [Actibacterium sp.]|uniref:hypothetical protein n=1 Tax=Actibacterium sp. TaxID=1872125 RepID=UPI0035651699
MRYLALALLGLLAACATPRQQCENAATQERDTVGALMIETEQNIARGYAIESHVETRPRFEFCYVTNPDGNIGLSFCNTVEPVEVERAVAIDLDAEKAKLKSLKAKFNTLSKQADAALAQCRIAYPE